MENYREKSQRKIEKKVEMEWWWFLFFCVTFDNGESVKPGFTKLLLSANLTQAILQCHFSPFCFVNPKANEISWKDWHFKNACVHIWVGGCTWPWRNFVYKNSLNICISMYFYSCQIAPVGLYWYIPDIAKLTRRHTTNTGCYLSQQHNYISILLYISYKINTLFLKKAHHPMNFTFTEKIIFSISSSHISLPSLKHYLFSVRFSNSQTVTLYSSHSFL